jgi:hypothetical protein
MGTDAYNELREVDIRRHMPPAVRDTDEFQQIAAAENPEFNELQRCIRQIMQDSFVEDATEHGVRRWEYILNITPAIGDSLEVRKNRILAYLSIKLPYTWRVLKRMLTTILGDRFSMNYVNDRGQLIIRTDILADSLFSNLTALLERVLPQHIEVIINQDFNQEIE